MPRVRVPVRAGEKPIAPSFSPSSALTTDCRILAAAGSVIYFDPAYIAKCCLNERHVTRREMTAILKDGSPL
jgi:hypothetical protein